MAKGPGAKPGRLKKVTVDKLVATGVIGSADASSLSQVADLQLSNRGVEDLADLSGLAQLRKLNVAKNKLSVLRGRVLAACPLLSWLQASENDISGEGLQGLRGLKALVTLNASRNRIASIPTSTLEACESLKALILNDNQIESTEWLKKLSSLTVLVLSRNRLGPRVNSRHLANLHGLQKINLTGNGLEELPDLSFCAESLVELRAANNRIGELPPSLSRCRKLKIVDLGHNKIASWDAIDALRECEAITHLNLKGNALCNWIGDASKDRRSESNRSSGESERSLPVNPANSDGGGPGGEAEAAYRERLRVMFPRLVIMDGARILLKRSHGFIKAEVDEDGRPQGADVPAPSSTLPQRSRTMRGSSSAPPASERARDGAAGRPKHLEKARRSSGQARELQKERKRKNAPRGDFFMLETKTPGMPRKRVKRQGVQLDLPKQGKEDLEKGAAGNAGSKQPSRNEAEVRDGSSKKQKKKDSSSSSSSNNNNAW